MLNGQNPSLLELKYLVHLVAHCSGELKPNYDWLDCINALHPTPAVAGTPCEIALDYITKKEPFSRGWYAGPMGTISKKNAKIVVAIRSGMVNGDSVILGAGAGIVADSNPEDEWNELDAKINVFSTLFNRYAMNYRTVEALIAAIIDYGVSDICIGAGSRSTVLIQALSQYPVKIHPFLDERAVGFFALGIAKTTLKPVRSLQPQVQR